jgi:hypothetical protein
MNNESKQEFFRSALIPTATLVNVLLSVLDIIPQSQSPESLRARVDMALNFVAQVVLDAPADTDLSSTKAAVLELRAVLTKALKSLNPKNGHYAIFELIQVPAQLEDKVNQIYTRLGVSAQGAAASLRSHKPRSPLLERYDSWRILTKMAPEKVFSEMNLSFLEEVVAALTSPTERQKAQKLWSELFAVTPEKSGSGSMLAGGPVPTNIGIVQLPSGYLEVTAVISPKNLVTPTDDGWVNIPNELAKKLETRRKVLKCSFKRLPEAVAECEQWLASVRAEANSLQAEYNAAMQAQKSSQLMQKLKSQFSDDEIAELQQEFQQRGFRG